MCRCSTSILDVPSTCCAGLANAPAAQQCGQSAWKQTVPEESTAFRRWHVGESCDVRELQQALVGAGLSSYVAVAEEWCRDVGAASLDEVREELDDLCSRLQLPRPRQEQLHSVILSVERSHMLAQDSDAFSHESERGAQSGGALQRSNSQISSSLVRSDSNFQAEHKEQEQTPGEPRLLRCGLRDALEDAGLQSHSAAVEAWCSEMGAAFLEEVLDEIDSVCAALHLTPQQSWRLQEVLEAYVARTAESNSRWSTMIPCGMGMTESVWVPVMA